MQTDLLAGLEQLCDQLGIGLFPLTADPAWIGDHIPDLSKLPRYAQGIIGQAQGDPAKPLDGGDSAHKTGFAAFCNSAQDQALLDVFEKDGIKVRHPTEVPWNNWKNCSRDQLCAYTAGCWRARKHDICQRLLEKHAARFPPFTCQNTEADAVGTTKNPPIGDPMGPHDVMCLRIAAGQEGAHRDLAGQFFMQAAIELADPDPQHEKNQLILQAILSGRLDLYVKIHPNFRDNIRTYWSGDPWRGQPQIAEEFIWCIEKELERYKNRLSIPPLFPHHVIDLLRTLDIKQELMQLNPLKHAELAFKFAEAAAGDIVEHAKATMIHHDAIVLPHNDIAPVHTDVAPIHTDAAGLHTDVAGVHADVAGVHTDFSVFGAHTDLIVTPHVDTTGPHVDGTGPHVDVTSTPHVDIVYTPHIDTAPVHVDAP